MTAEQLKQLVAAATAEQTDKIIQSFSVVEMASFIKTLAAGYTFTGIYLSFTTFNMWRDMFAHIALMLGKKYKYTTSHNVTRICANERLYDRYVTCIMGTNTLANEWAYQYDDSTTYTTPDGAVMVGDETLSIKGKAGYPYILLIFPRSNWDK